MCNISADQVTPHWRSKQFIASAPNDCTCPPPVQVISVFEHVSNSCSSKLAKQLPFSNEDATPDDEYPEVSVNVVERDTGKQPASEPENSATPGVYMGTRSRSGTAQRLNYRAFAQRHDKAKGQFAIMESQSFSSSRKIPVPSAAANTPEVVAQH